MSLIQMSLSAAVMITVIVIVRALALNKLPKITFCILWWIVLVRLLVPYSLPCELSVYSILAPHDQAPQAAAADISPIMYSIGSVNAANFTASPESVSPEATPIIGIKTVVWIIGMLGTGAYFSLSYFFAEKGLPKAFPPKVIF